MLDPVIHPLPRLRICASLRAAGAVEHVPRHAESRQMRFAELRQAAGLSESALSKHLSTLETAGYVLRHRSYGSVRGDDVVWVALTDAGLRAFEGHMASLREIAAE